MTTQAIARLKDTSATIEEAIAFVQEAVTKSKLSEYITSVKLGPYKSIRLVGKTRLGKVEFNLSLDPVDKNVYFDSVDDTGIDLETLQTPKLDSARRTDHVSKSELSNLRSMRVKETAAFKSYVAAAKDVMTFNARFEAFVSKLLEG